MTYCLCCGTVPVKDDLCRDCKKFCSSYFGVPVKDKASIVEIWKTVPVEKK